MRPVFAGSESGMAEVSQKQFKKLRKLLRDSGAAVPERESMGMIHTRTLARIKVNHPHSKRGMYRKLKKQLRAKR